MKTACFLLFPLQFDRIWEILKFLFQGWGGILKLLLGVVVFGIVISPMWSGLVTPGLSCNMVEYTNPGKMSVYFWSRSQP